MAETTDSDKPIVKERVIPCKITNTYWIWNETSEGYHRQDDPAGGKWLTFLDKRRTDIEGLTLLDKAWFKIEAACNSGELYRAKVSTALTEPHAKNDASGVIVCYTKDFGDREEVFKTGMKIRVILERETERLTLLYKTNSATESRLYPKLGIKNVTLYKIDPFKRFFERVEGNWKLVDQTKLAPGLESDSDESD